MSNLTSSEIDKLRDALGLLPKDIEGSPLCDIVRRKTFDRRRVSIIPGGSIPGQHENFDLWKLCRFRPVNGDLVQFGWAMRSKTSGDYFVYSEVW